MDDRSEEQSYAEISRSMNQPLRDREATNLSRIVRNVAHCRLKRTELESTRSICRWIGSKLALYELAFTVAIAGWLPMRRNANSHTASRLAVRMHTDTDAPYKLAPRYPLLLTSPLLSSPLLSSLLLSSSLLFSPLAAPWRSAFPPTPSHSTFFVAFAVRALSILSLPTPSPFHLSFCVIHL